MKLFIDWTDMNSPYYSHQKVFFSYDMPHFYLKKGVSSAELHELSSFLTSLFSSSDTKGRIISLTYGNGIGEIEIKGGEYDKVSYIRITDYVKICIQSDIFVPLSYLGGYPYDHPLGRIIYKFQNPVVVIRHQDFRFRQEDAQQPQSQETPEPEPLDDLEGQERFI